MYTVMADSSLGNQIRVADIVSNYPENDPQGVLTQIGSIAQGAIVNKTTTINVAQTSFEQGQFFKAFSKVNFDQLAKTESKDGNETWSYSKKINGVDHSVTLNKVDILSSVTLEEVKSQSQIDAMAKKYKIKKEETYIVVDGKKYFAHMNVPMHFGTGQHANIIMDTVYFVVAAEGVSTAIAGVIAKLGIDAFTTALTNINTQVFKVLWSAITGVVEVSYVFLQSFVGAIVGGETVAAALAAGQAAVGEAITEGAFAAVTASALAYTVVGILVIASIYLILTYALHYTYQNVYVYNLTKYDLDFNFGYIYEGNEHNVESKHLPAYEKKVGPNNIDLGSWYSATGFRFQSDSQFYGLGYAMSLSLKDAGSQNVAKQMACMFDIPYIGKNSLRASATKPSSIEKFYKDNEGKITKNQHSQNDGEVEIIVTYDYLSGAHADPETGNKDYIYNSLVIVRELTPDFEISPSALLQNDGYLSIADNSAYHFGKEDFTLEAWIKPTTSGTIFGKKPTAGGSDSCAGFLLVLQPDGALKLATDNGFGYSQVMSDATDIFNGDWHHVSAVRSNGSLEIFLNGEAVQVTSSGSLPSPLNVSNTLDLEIGRVQQNQEPHIHYIGAISEARVWNIALTVPQIKQGINGKLTGKESGLVGYWSLHSNGQDLSPTKNNAEISGDVVFGKN